MGFMSLLGCCFRKICMKEKPLIYTKPRNYRKNMGLSMSVEDIWGFMRIMLLFPICIGNKGTSISNFFFIFVVSKGIRNGNCASVSYA